MMLAGSVLVTFVVSHGVWNAGETAGFTEDKAGSLIEAKIATPADGADAAPEPAPEPGPKPKGKPKPAPASAPVPEPEPA
jgi:hypothetical protein